MKGWKSEMDVQCAHIKLVTQAFLLIRNVHLLCKYWLKLNTIIILHIALPYLLYIFTRYYRKNSTPNCTLGIKYFILSMHLFSIFLVLLLSLIWNIMCFNFKIINLITLHPISYGIVIKKKNRMELFSSHDYNTFILVKLEYYK